MLILIADDEILIRQGIAARIAAMDLPHMDPLFAEDGTQALRLIRERDIALVLSDIKMLSLDGIELIKLAKQIKPDLPFILISGYAEFLYAKEAMRYGVQDYLLKPFSTQELKEALQRALTRIAEKEALYLDRKMVEECHLIEKEQTLFRLINDWTYHKNLSCEKLRALTTALNVENVQLLTLGQCRFGSAQQEDEIRAFFRLYAQESGAGFLYAQDYSYKNRWWIILADTSDEAAEEREKHFFQVLERRLKTSLSSNRRAVVSFSGLRAVDADGFAREARDAGAIRFKDEMSHLSVFENLSDTALNELDNRLLLIDNSINGGDPVAAAEKLDALFSPHEADVWASPYIRRAWNHILHSLYSLNKPWAPSQYALLEDFRSKLEKLDTLETRTALLEALHDELQVCRPDGAKQKQSSQERIILAEKYLKEHFAKDIALNELAARFNMSPNYFSGLFKKHFNKTVSGYVLETRMRKAREFLRDTERNVVDIARDVGYEDTQYFFRLFKKETGETPLTYRRHSRQEKMDGV